MRKQNCGKKIATAAKKHHNTHHNAYIVDIDAWVVNKPSANVRLCIDPKPLNKVLRRDHYKMFTINDVPPLLDTQKFFHLLTPKMLSGTLSSASIAVCYLIMLGTSYGKFRRLRIPYGIALALEF